MLNASSGCSIVARALMLEKGDDEMARRREDIEAKFFERKIRPVRKDGVMILCDEENVEETLDSGIIVPVKPSHDRLMTATVLGVGKHVQELVPGSRIMVNRAYGHPIPHDDARYCKFTMITQDQIELLIEDDEG
jgi:co-chaperonin GroES (HSP10)